jgi:hypothetical protein
MRTLSWKPTFRIVWICCKSAPNGYSRNVFCFFTVLCPSNLLLLKSSDLWRWVPAFDVEYRGLTWPLSEHQLFFVRVAWYQDWCKLTFFCQFIWIHYQTSDGHYITFKRRGRHTKLKSRCVSCHGNLLSELFEFVVNLLQMASREIVFVFLRFYVQAIFYCWLLLTSEGEFQHLTLNIEA